jgi:hypothetical protein
MSDEETYRFNHSVRDRRQVFSLSILAESQGGVREYLNPVTRWCAQKFGPAGGHSSARWRTKITRCWGGTHNSKYPRDISVRVEISFRKEADAIAFKLRWG